MVDHADRRPRGLAESYEPKKVVLQKCFLFIIFLKLLFHITQADITVMTINKVFLTTSVRLFRDGSRGVQCILLFTGVPGHSGDGLLHQEAEVPGGSGIQL